MKYNRIWDSIFGLDSHWENISECLPLGLDTLFPEQSASKLQVDKFSTSVRPYVRDVSCDSRVSDQHTSFHIYKPAKNSALEQNCAESKLVFCRWTRVCTKKIINKQYYFFYLVLSILISTYILYYLVQSSTTRVIIYLHKDDFVAIATPTCYAMICDWQRNRFGRRERLRPSSWAARGTSM